MIALLSKELSSLKEGMNLLAQLQGKEGVMDKAYLNLKIEHETELSHVGELQNTILVLNTESKDLTDRLEKSERYKLDNIEIYGSGGNKNDKLTYHASKIKKINLSVDVPQSLTETISFKIITPTGLTIIPEDKSLAWSNVLDSKNLTASLSSVSGNFENSRKVMLTYTPRKKLPSGEYMIQIFSNDKNIRTCRLKLR